jgi:Holliday junction resolvasome RuvABC endonuclease subunit
MTAEARLHQLVECLGLLVERWRPGAVAHSLPSGIHWPVPALELLNAALVQWSLRHRLRLYAYTAQEVRAAIAGHPNASRDQLAYAVMLSLGLIGQGKTTHEWEALAVGHYHLSRFAKGVTPRMDDPAPG